MSKRDGATVARKLKDAILRMELRPGVLLDETRLADAYKVSRTPIREAIIQLIADGLVTALASDYHYPAPLSAVRRIAVR